MNLRQQIEAEIRRRGPMRFSRYMEICLYDPVSGYYARHVEQFGKSGDFYTSSDVHAVFGRLLARRFEEMWRALGRPERIELLELGPGRGLFARDVLDWAGKKFPDFHSALRYTLQESSPALRLKLRQRLSEHLESGRAVVAEPTEGVSPMGDAEPGRLEACGSPVRIARSCSQETPRIIFANEFFDALPVEIVSTLGTLHLAEGGGGVKEIWLPLADKELEFLERFGVHPEPGERIEVPLVAQRWMQQIGDAISRGFLLVIDYGYTRGEQLAGHHRGTLMTYRQHSVGGDPYQAPGEQDLTAHVNFTALAAAARSTGMQVQELQTQSQFLIRIGEGTQFADAFEECRLPQEAAKVALQLKHLITPAGMGETFRVLEASRFPD